MKSYELITILGPTASGKTTFAAALAAQLDTEIISADSRQIYRSMDIGTGKDLADYNVNGKQIPYHLIDICEPGYKYNVFEYQHDFFRVYEDMKRRGKLPILCGGTGMYIEAVLKGYKLLDVPQNPELRESLRNKTLEELETILASYKILHNKTDVDTAQRAIRAIEIEEYYKTQAPDVNEYNPINSLIIGIHIDRELRREKISRRLRTRLDEGMVDEVRGSKRRYVFWQNRLTSIFFRQEFRCGRHRNLILCRRFSRRGNGNICVISGCTFCMVGCCLLTGFPLLAALFFLEPGFASLFNKFCCRFHQDLLFHLQHLAAFTDIYRTHDGIRYDRDTLDNA